MKSRLAELLGRLHTRISRSDWVVWALVLRIANQCQAVIRARLNDGRNPEENGEYLLHSLVASDAQVFIDVGANVGYWTRHFASLMKHTRIGLLIVPSPEALVELRKLAAGLGFRTIVINAAAGDQLGHKTFFAEPNSGESSSFVSGFSAGSDRPITVRVTTVDEEILSRGIEFVDFLKIDAEGFDLKVLMGAEKALRQEKSAL